MSLFSFFVSRGCTSTTFFWLRSSLALRLTWRWCWSLYCLLQKSFDLINCAFSLRLLIQVHHIFHICAFVMIFKIKQHFFGSNSRYTWLIGSRLLFVLWRSCTSKKTCRFLNNAKSIRCTLISFTWLIIGGGVIQILRSCKPNDQIPRFSAID